MKGILKMQMEEILFPLSSTELSYLKVNAEQSGRKFSF